MIDNFHPKVVVDGGGTPTYNDNVRWSDDGYFTQKISTYKVDDELPFEIRRSTTKRGYRMSENSVGEDIYIDVQPTADGTKTVAWYYIEDAPCVISDPHYFFAPSYPGAINYMELSGFELTDDEEPMASIMNSFSSENSGNVLDMRGMSLDPNISTGYYNLDFSLFYGDIYLPSTDAVIRELNFASFDGNIYGINGLENVVRYDFSNVHTEQSLDFSGIDLGGCEYFHWGYFEGDVNLNNITFGGYYPDDFWQTLPSNTTVQGWDLSHLEVGSNNLDSILSNIEDNRDVYDLTGWKIPSSPISQDGCLYNSYFPNVNVTDWDLSVAANIDYLFNVAQFPEQSSITGLNTWDVSSVTSMAYLFGGNYVPSLEDLEDWDVSNVENFNHIFDGEGTQYDPNQHMDVPVTDYTTLNSWRDLLSTTASYTEMFGDIDIPFPTLPEWNGWFDESSTFIPYTGDEISGGIYFKGFILNQSPDPWTSEDMPANPNTGDAYRIYPNGYDTGYYSGYWAYDGTQWLDFSGGSIKEYIEYGYYSDCDNYWECINVTQGDPMPIEDSCGYYELGDQHDFFFAPSGTGEEMGDPHYYLGRYQWDGIGWYLLPQTSKLYLKNGDDTDDWWAIPDDESSIPNNYTNYIYTKRIDESQYQYGYYTWTWDGTDWTYNEPTE